MQQLSVRQWIRYRSLQALDPVTRDPRTGARTLGSNLSMSSAPTPAAVDDKIETARYCFTLVVEVVQALATCVRDNNKTICLNALSFDVVCAETKTV